MIRADGNEEGGPMQKCSLRAVHVYLIGQLLSLAACAPQTTWPKFHHDLAQTGLSQFSTSANTGALKWRFATGGAVVSSPAIADDGTIYFGSDDRNLYAITPAGGLKWKFPTSGAVSSSPALGDGGVIHVAAGADLYAINPDGSLKWKVTLGGAPISASPAIAPNGAVYIGATDGNFYAVDAAGSPIWKTFLYPGASIVRSPAIGADGTIYFGAESQTFYALDGANGAQKWTFPHQSPGATSAAIAADGTIYFGSQDSNLYALNPDGSKRWSFPAAPIVGSSPAIAADGTIHFGSTTNRTLYAVTPTGGLKWKLTTGDWFRRSSPAIGSEGTVYVGSHEGNLLAVDASGSLKWKFHTPGAISSSPAIAPDGTVYFGSGDGNLYAVGPPRPPELYVADDGDTAQLLVYDLATWSNTPLRTISGSATGLSAPQAVSFDDVHDEVLVANYGPPASITTYAATASGNVAPLRTLSLPVGPSDLFVDTVNDELYVVYGHANVDVFSRSAIGGASPIRKIAGASTQLGGATSVSVDAVNNEIFVANTASQSVAVFPRSANGNVAPIRILQGTNTTLCVPASIFVDTIHDELFVGAPGNASIPCDTVLASYQRTASSNIAPIRSIPGTPRPYPAALAADTVRDEIVVANAGLSSITSYARTANGSTPPAHLLSGTSGQVMRGVAVRNNEKTVVLNAVASGFYSQSGSHTSGNYASGWYGNSSSPPNNELRDYFVFDLSKITGKIKSAVLRLSAAPGNGTGYLSSDASETYTLFDVSAAPASVSGGTGGVAVFNDLGAGTSYGSLVATSAMPQIVEIPLNPAGIALLSSNSGTVAIGGAVTTLVKGADHEFVFNATNSSLTRKLVITTD